MSNFYFEDGESEFATVIVIACCKLKNAAQQKLTTQRVALRSCRPDSSRWPSHNPLTLSPLALTACSVARSQFLFVTTFDSPEQSLHCLVSFLYH